MIDLFYTEEKSHVSPDPFQKQYGLHISFCIPCLFEGSQPIFFLGEGGRGVEVPTCMSLEQQKTDLDTSLQ